MSARVNRSLLPKYIGKTVRIVGKIGQMDSNKFQLMTYDNGFVFVHLTNPESQITTAFVEVIGVVNPDLTIRENITISIGDNVDLSTLDRMIELSQHQASIFGTV